MDGAPHAHRLDLAIREKGKAEFGTIRLALLKVGARIIQTRSRIRVAFASACPEANLFRQISLRLRAPPA